MLHLWTGSTKTSRRESVGFVVLLLFVLSVSCGLIAVCVPYLLLVVAYRLRLLAALTFDLIDCWLL